MSRVKRMQHAIYLNRLKCQICAWPLVHSEAVRSTKVKENKNEKQSSLFAQMLWADGKCSAIKIPNKYFPFYLVHIRSNFESSLKIPWENQPSLGFPWQPNDSLTPNKDVIIQNNPSCPMWNWLNEYDAVVQAKVSRTYMSRLHTHSTLYSITFKLIWGAS